MEYISHKNAPLQCLIRLSNWYHYRSSIPEENSDSMISDKDHGGSVSTMRRASIQPGVNIFQKEGMMSRGNLLSTVNGNFTAATRTGLLSNPRIQC